MSEIERFLVECGSALREGNFVRLSLSRPADSAAGPERAVLRPVVLKGGPRIQRVLKHQRRDLTENLTDAEALEWCRSVIGTAFHAAHLSTTRRDFQLLADPARPLRLERHKPARTDPVDTSHDRRPRRELEVVQAPWLASLGVVDAQGKVRERMGDKFRQVARYTDILGDLVDDLGWKRGQPVRAVDMGSGKGYLTFAAWQLLRVIRGLDAEVAGVEERVELAEGCERIAREHGCTGLSFRAGRIAGTDCTGMQIVIALHACNTATDDALVQGIRAGADLILAAPCCHQELRPQLDGWGGHGILAPILRHGLMRERFSEWLTDGLRALHLELAGYDTKVIEFVGGEHTPKNLLLAAVKRQRPASPGLRDKIAAIRAQFGVMTQALDPLASPEPGPARA